MPEVTGAHSHPFPFRTLPGPQPAHTAPPMPAMPCHAGADLPVCPPSARADGGCRAEPPRHAAPDENVDFRDRADMTRGPPKLEPRESREMRSPLSSRTACALPPAEWSDT